MKETRREQTAHYIAAPQAESLQVAELGESEGQVNPDHLINILEEIQNVELELEELQEGGDLEDILDCSLRLEDLKRNHARMAMTETGG